MSNKTINSWDWDIRVRERKLKNGTLTDKDVEKHIAPAPGRDEQSDARDARRSPPSVAAKTDARAWSEAEGGSDRRRRYPPSTSRRSSCR